MKLNVCVAGATGWVGAPLCCAISRSEDLALSGAVSRKHEGRRLGDVVGDEGLDVTVSRSVTAALEAPADVLVDYTSAEAVRANVLAAIGRGVHVVVGS